MKEDFNRDFSSLLTQLRKRWQDFLDDYQEKVRRNIYESAEILFHLDNQEQQKQYIETYIFETHQLNEEWIVLQRDLNRSISEFYQYQSKRMRVTEFKHLKSKICPLPFF